MAKTLTYSRKTALKLLAEKTYQKHHNIARPTVQHTTDPVESTNWRDHANCLGLNHQMFPRKHKDISYITIARQICRDCSVREPCLDNALEYPTTDMHGVWAGLTPRQLAAKQHERGITPSKPTLAQIWNNFNKLESSPTTFPAKGTKGWSK